ncbi:MAG TPA: Yip1 family protein [Dehalococcoidia bacterium]|nr:Yip1 family protein [Dehalococcoidia bacterium]
MRGGRPLRPERFVFRGRTPMLDFNRVKNILVSPKSEWQTIGAESATTQSLYTGYVIPLALIRPVCSFIGLSLIGVSWFGGHFRVPIASGIAHAVLDFALTLVAVYVLALVIDALAPTFGGQKDQTQALKVSVYSSTAAWLAGVFYLVPALSILGLLGLYSLYLLYLGLPVLMKAPQDKALGYTAVVVIAAIIIFVVVGAVASVVVPHPGLNIGISG